ncbi:hypothetical protein [Nocardia sp. NPDC003963]
MPSSLMNCPSSPGYHLPDIQAKLSAGCPSRVPPIPLPPELPDEFTTARAVPGPGRSEPGHAQVAGCLAARDYGPSFKLMEHCRLGDPFVAAVERVLTSPTRVVRAGGHADKESDSATDLYRQAETATKVASPTDIPVGRYVINHDILVHVDKSTITPNAVGCPLHPLPILTAEGNGLGSDDLHEDKITGDYTLVGTWARNRITVADTEPHGYQPLTFDLIELEPW